jgi:Flp pilus assembly protein TadB
LLNNFFEIIAVVSKYGGPIKALMDELTSIFLDRVEDVQNIT